METTRKSPLFYRHAHWYFLLVMGITAFAFSPSYFLRLSKTDASHHFHGITASLWLLMLVVQPFLHRQGWMTAHRWVGKFSLVVAPLVVISAYSMIGSMMSAKNYPPLIPYQLAFIDFFTLFLFTYFYLKAIFHRKNLHLHARYMVCTVLGPLIPTLTRFFFIIPIVNSFSKSLNLSYLVVELVLVILIWDDKKRGSFQKPYVVAFLVFIVQHILMNFASDWVWWRNLLDGIYL